jgi:Anthrone oxygenase
VSEAVAVFCSGVFFGVALYISLVQQPAALELGTGFAGRYFPAMYRRAAPLQVTLAFAGTLASLWCWWRGAGGAWLVGALLLFAVVPFTLIAILPVTNRLLDDRRAPDAADIDTLLRRWSVLHAVRTALSGAAFALLLMAMVLG